MLVFSEFLDYHPTCQLISSSITARKVFDLVRREDIRIAMVEASKNGKPALSACAKEIEIICLENNSDISLDDMTKRIIGRMASFCLKPLGYYSVKHPGLAKVKILSKKLGLKYFKNASVFSYTGSCQVERIISRIETL
jgi:hypothetical protein